MKGRFFQVLIPLALVGAVLIMGRATWRMWQRSAMAQANLSSSMANLDRLSKRKVTLEQKMAKIKTSRGVEEELRVNFAIVRPGEKVVNIVDNEQATTAPTSTPVAKPWWQIF